MLCCRSGAEGRVGVGAGALPEDDGILGGVKKSK